MIWNKIKKKLVKVRKKEDSEIEVKLAIRKNGYRGEKTNVMNTIFVGERMRNPIAAVSELSYDSIRIAVTAMGKDIHFHPLIEHNPIARGLRGCLGVRPKDDFIEYYGIKAYYKWQQQIIYWKRSHPSKVKEYNRKSHIKRRQKVKANKEFRKGGE